MNSLYPVAHIANHAASLYIQLPHVEAVVAAGSHSTGYTDPLSDIDLYIYTRTAVPLCERARIATGGASRFEINNQSGEPGDAWVDADSGISVDVMFRRVEWIEAQLDRVLREHTASIGYSTCFWHNVLFSRVFYDHNGWFHDLQQRANQPYPEELRNAIIKKNYSILHRNIFSYTYQLDLAVAREDLVSINHRVTAILSSYFDILFAVNRLPHPGEKRLVITAEKQCRRIPKGMRKNVNNLVRSASLMNRQVIDSATLLIDNLDRLLKEEGAYPEG